MAPLHPSGVQVFHYSASFSLFGQFFFSHRLQFSCFICGYQASESRIKELNSWIPGWWVFPPVNHKQLALILTAARQTHTHTNTYRVYWLTELRDTFFLPSLAVVFGSVILNISQWVLVYCIICHSPNLFTLGLMGRYFSVPRGCLWVLFKMIHLILEQLILKGI